MPLSVDWSFGYHLSPKCIWIERIETPVDMRLLNAKSCKYETDYINRGGVCLNGVPLDFRVVLLVGGGRREWKVGIDIMRW